MVTTVPQEKSRRCSSKHSAGLLITPRLEDILISLWYLRQLTLDQLTRVHYGISEKKSSLPHRDCQKYVEHRLLRARPLPVERSAGRPPLVYFLGEAAAPILARLLHVDNKDVVARIKQDEKLSWFSFPHRLAISECCIALGLACRRASYALEWIADEELAGMKLKAHVGKNELPVRPDAFMVITGTSQDGTRITAPRFLELQMTSQPHQYRAKAEAYAAFYASGTYEKLFKYRGMRVLAVTDTDLRAQHLKAVVEKADVPEPRLFWSTSLGKLVKEPFGKIWLVANRAEQQADTQQLRSILG